MGQECWELYAGLYKDSQLINDRRSHLIYREGSTYFGKGASGGCSLYTESSHQWHLYKEEPSPTQDRAILYTGGSISIQRRLGTIYHLYRDREVSTLIQGGVNNYIGRSQLLYREVSTQIQGGVNTYIGRSQLLYREESIPIQGGVNPYTGMD